MSSSMKLLENVKVLDYFPDAEKILKSALMIQKILGFEMLDENNRFCLKKHMTNVRRQLLANKGKGTKQLKL